MIVLLSSSIDSHKSIGFFIFNRVFLFLIECPYFQQKIKTHKFLQIFDLNVELNSMSFFIIYTLINN